MAEEQSIKNQIAAMESWAIKAGQSADASKYKEAEDLLRTINAQGRRLEWRRKLGLNHLPDLEEVKVLKKKISEARAAVQEAQSSIQHLGKLAKKEGKKPEEITAINRKENGYKSEIRKSTSIMIQVLKEARAISDAEPWINQKVLSNPKNNKVLLQFLKSEGYYRAGTWWGTIKSNSQANAKITEQIDFKGNNFKRADLRGANLHRANLEGLDFTKANLSGVHCEVANFSRAKLTGANLNGAQLEGANFSGANLQGTDFTRARIAGAKFEGADIAGANFDKVIGLSGKKGTLGVNSETLRLAMDKEKAKNIPDPRWWD